MFRTLALCAALSAPLAAQVLGPPPPENAPLDLTDAELFDSVQLIVNSDCITHSDLLRETWQRGQAGEGGGDLQKLYSGSGAGLTRQLLLQGAGRDLGYDPAMIEATVRREVAAKRERFGAAGLADFLEATRKDSSMLFADTEGTVYRYLYERAITGEGAGPGGRAYVDNYVRPGQLSLAYRRQGSRLDLPPVVHLQEIIVAPGVSEDLGHARQRAFLVRSRALRGDDFAALNREFGVATKRVGNEFRHETDLEPIEEPRLDSLPELREFVRGAQPGDISEPLPATLAGGKIGGWRLVRLVDRVEGVAQRFEDREFQESLRERMLAARKEYLIERALRKLMLAAYVWPTPPPRRPAEAPAEAPVAAPEPAAPPAIEPASVPPEPQLEQGRPPPATRAIGAPEPEPVEGPVEAALEEPPWPSAPVDGPAASGTAPEQPSGGGV